MRCSCMHVAGYYASAIPVGNAVDVNIRRVFFVSCTPTFIASMNYDGSDIEVVASTSADVDKPYDIALDPESRCVRSAHINFHYFVVSSGHLITVGCFSLSATTLSPPTPPFHHTTLTLVFILLNTRLKETLLRVEQSAALI